jgi:alginate O-acetyltransferase complex protein AlgI
MVFSSTIFLFLFLPLALLGYFILPKALRNLFLLLISLLFYAWGEGNQVLLMITSILVNYVGGFLIGRFRRKDGLARLFLALSVTVNLSFLLYYKYFNFFIDNIHRFGFSFFTKHEGLILPIGISFYTFHGISYLVDVYRKDAYEQKEPIRLGLYIAFFPQLIAGPIIRYHDIAEQLSNRKVTPKLFTEGIIRFIRGLAKKLIIANTVALIADETFALPPQDIPASIAWLGIICYTLQIYFDFSGYSDMAIGLAKMFGFNFRENFNYPYISQSIQEFWRRWHISLSSWFRDYLYIPLGGNRKGKFRTYLNLLIVFFITGLWHGASLNFIFWGLFHGLFLILERSKLINTDRFPAIFRHLYALVVVIIGWVFFRADNLHAAIGFLKSMAGLQTGTNYTPLIYITNYSMFVLGLAVLFSTPIRKLIADKVESLQQLALVSRYGFYTVLFVLSILELAQSSYNPFIYYRF